MFNWLKEIFRPEPLNYSTTNKGLVPPEIIRGKFRYECIVSCPRGERSIIEVYVTDSVTQPSGRCPCCNRKVLLLDAPIRETVKIGDSEHTYQRHSLVRLDLGEGHSVTLGKTIEYSVDI